MVQKPFIPQISISKSDPIAAPSACNSRCKAIVDGIKHPLEV